MEVIDRRAAAFRALQLAVCGAVALILGVLSPEIPWSRWPELVFFTALTALALRLRIRYAGNFVGVEAAALVPAILLLGSPGAAVLICLVADGIAKALQRPRRLSLSNAFDVAQLALAYGAAALFARALNAAGAGWVTVAALATGVLLVFYFINTALVFAYLELGRVAARERMLEIAVFQLVALLLLAPIVILEILVYMQQGVPGMLLAFFPVVLASFVMRSLSSMERRVQEVSRRNLELDAMRDISTTFGVSARVDRYERVFAAIARLLPVQAAAVLEWGDGDEPSVHVSDGAAESRRDVLAWARRERFDERRVDRWSASEELATGEARPVRLAPELPYQVRTRLSTFEMHTGMLIVESASPSLHAPETIASLRAVAAHIALVLQDRSVRAQVEELSQRNRQRAETLNQILEVSNDLKRHRTLDDLFQSITTAVAKSLGFQRVVLSTYERERNVFVPRAHIGAEKEWGVLRSREVPAEEITRWWTERHRVSKSFHVRERRGNDTDPSLRAAAPRRVLAAGEDAWRAEELIWIPLYSEDRLLGCLSVDDPRDGRSPSVETIRALEIFANQAVVAIENARSYAEAREQSIRDSLTGAYNHRHFQEVLQRELGRAERVGRPLAVLMLDIDDFKSINDRFGHPVGDAILQGIVSEIRNEVRGDMDLLARYGGDEFALVLPETPMSEAVLVAERVRRRIDERLFRMPDSRAVLRATVSIGLAAYPEDTTEKKSLVEMADAALYRAKHGGKNAVVATSEPGPGQLPLLPH